MSVVSLKGKRHLLSKLQDDYPYWWVTTAIVMCIMWAIFAFGALMFDVWNKEDVVVTNNQGQAITNSDGTVKTYDDSWDINYLPIFAFLGIPAATVGLGLWTDKRENANNRVVVVADGRTDVVAKFDQFGKSRSYDQPDVELVWLGGIQKLNALVESIKLQVKAMDGPFGESVEDSQRAAEMVRDHTVNTYVYLRPVMQLSSSNDNASLLSATEKMIMDVRECATLHDSCSELYVKSGLSMPHAQILQTEVEKIADRLRALEDIDRHALTTGTKV